MVWVWVAPVALASALAVPAESAAISLARVVTQPLAAVDVAADVVAQAAQVVAVDAAAVAQADLPRAAVEALAEVVADAAAEAEEAVPVERAVAVPVADPTEPQHSVIVPAVDADPNGRLPWFTTSRIRLSMRGPSIWLRLPPPVLRP
jgi:hypothetical protein